MSGSYLDGEDADVRVYTESTDGSPLCYKCAYYSGPYSGQPCAMGRLNTSSAVSYSCDVFLTTDVED